VDIYLVLSVKCVSYKSAIGDWTRVLSNRLFMLANQYCIITIHFIQGITLLLSPFFIINTPKCCMNLTEEDRVAFGGQRSQQFQPVSYTSQLTDASYPESHPGTYTHR